MENSTGFSHTIPFDFSSWPKIDLHRHLAGSIRSETWLDLMQIQEPDFSISPQELEKKLTVQSQVSLNEYLTRFAWLDRCLKNEAALWRVTYEAVADAANDQLIYVEFRFSPARFAEVSGLSIQEVLKTIIAASQAAERDFPIHVGLIAGLSREMGVERCRQVAAQITSFAGQGVVGIDLLGEEGAFPAQWFQPIFEPIAQQGALGITVHAGEDSGAYNVRDAVLLLGAQRIGHGTQAAGSPEVMELLEERQITIEACPTSNVQTGSVTSYASHPLPIFLKHGVQATINTDNPKVSLTSLSQEYKLAWQDIGLSKQQIATTLLHAVQGAFAAPELKQELIQKIQTELRPFLSEP